MCKLTFVSLRICFLPYAVNAFRYRKMQKRKAVNFYIYICLYDLLKHRGRSSAGATASIALRQCKSRCNRLLKPFLPQHYLCRVCLLKKTVAPWRRLSCGRRCLSVSLFKTRATFSRTDSKINASQAHLNNIK